MNLIPSSLEAGYTQLQTKGRVMSSSRLSKYFKIGLVLSIICFLVILLQPLSVAQKYNEKYNLVTINNAIPNFVHYVHIKASPDTKLEFRFAHFLSLYAAVLNVRASKVYIHTDYSASEIAEAGRKGGMWTKKVMNTFPELIEWKPVQVPQYAGTNENVKVKALQHKSDFLRWSTIAPIGGVYMDWDVIVLRPLKPLLNAGFAVVAGRQMHNDPNDHNGSNGEMNNGIFMTRANSLMANIMAREQSANFADEWSDNLKFMTRVAERLVSVPGEVLICDRNAFNPTTWMQEAKDQLFLTHNETSPEPREVDVSDPVEAYQTVLWNRRARAEWEWEFSSSYTIHAFGQSHYYEWVTPKKILGRTSNYGVAAWSIVKKMVKDGAISGKEDNW
ncbi:hypothetical protein GRF29_1536g375800 [Pseudopithomyces chartarum]|uniref:Uncharacterized protein n=1 Tax=Pseudopithomyces chartarum TaxID=1892770 RepID=A0AAN6RDJ7_9PLEO|nr:hypothetical protein GRF29_1536g375800 [Pseudopithomyces chartarum]